MSTYHKLICPIIDLDGKIDYSINESIEYTIKGNNINSNEGDIVFSENPIYGPVMNYDTDEDMSWNSEYNEEDD